MGILMGGVVRSSATHGPLVFANVCITGTLHCYGTDGNGLWNDLSDNGAYAYSGVSVTASAGGFNAKTINMNNIAYYPDLGINGLWEIIELDPAPAPPSCFTGDTEVLLADATTRPIEEIGVGELVVGRDGRISRVVAIERPLLGDRPLYSLDGGTPFVTGEHPFLTPAGWAAIEPSATAAENPQLHVAQLGAGDTLLRVLHARALAPVGGPIERVELEMAEQPLDRVRAVRRAPDVTVHNLLLDGDHTYLANGYVVHNKNGSH